MKSLSRNHSKSSRNTRPKSTALFHTTDNVESVIDCTSVGQCDELCDNEFDQTISMNNSAIFDGPDQSLWSYENNGFYSLPSRGNKRYRRPGIKFMINSETVSQTKILVYKDHQKSQNLPIPNPVIPKQLNKSQSSSTSSLNSNNDPDTAAALDQIASEMGLIEHPVLRQSNDPVKYLLAKRSFSERIPSKNINFVNNNGEPRSRSQLEQKKQIMPSPNLKGNRSLSNSSPINSSQKKQSRISRILEKLSPNLSRRSRSTSAAVLKAGQPESPSLKLNNCINLSNSVKNEIKTTTKDTVLSTESIKSASEPSSNKPQLTYVNENTKKILNSLKVDRIDQLQNKFRNISKRRTEVNGVCQTVDIIPRRAVETFKTPVSSAYSKSQDTPNGSPLCQYEKQSITNARYVNVSLCAFGYGPHQRAYQSPFHSGSVNVSRDEPIPECISNNSNDSSGGDETTRKSVTKEMS